MKLTTLAGLAALAAMLFELGAQAVPPAPRDVKPPSSSMIPRALGVYVTQRGQRYFAENLLDLIERKGYALDEGGFPGWRYQADEAIVLDQLPDAIRGRLDPVRKILNRWLRGFELGDPLIQAEIPGISYSARFKRFGIRIDQAETARQGKKGLLAIVFEAEIPEIRIETDWVHANDQHNKFLGVFGINRPWLSLTPASQPLRIQIPMLLHLKRGGHLHFEMKGVSTNLSADDPLNPKVDFDMGLARPMVLPLVTATINGQTLTLDQRRLEEKLLSQKPKLIDALQTYIDGHAREKLPLFITELVNENYSDLLLSDYNEMDPPGAGRPTGPSERYRWGIVPEELKASADHVMVGLSAFVDDPRARDPRAEVSRRQVKEAPALDRLDPLSYDIALTVSEDLVNRLLGLGYQRGYYPTMEVPGGKPLEMLQAPEFRFTSGSSSDHGKLHIKVRHHAEGRVEEAAMLRNQVTFEMDLNARLFHPNAGKVSVAVDSIDVDSLSVYTGSLLRGTRKIAIGRIVKKLNKANLELGKSPHVVVDALPIPSQINGIPIQVRDFRADPHGYLVLYLEYDLGR
jgi:hypothetical protein